MSELKTPQKESNFTITRRQFLGTAGCALAAATFPTIIPASALGKDGTVAPGSRITLGVIG